MMAGKRSKQESEISSMSSSSSDDEDDNRNTTTVSESINTKSDHGKYSPKKQRSKQTNDDNIGTSAAKAPKGLEPLVVMNSIIIKQNVELVEVMCGCETSNSYEIQNSLGQKWFTAQEVSWCCFRNCCSFCCGSSRPFTMEIKDLHNEPVLRIQRPWKCQKYWCCCCRQNVTVELADGTKLGQVSQQFSCIRPWFKVTSAAGETLYKIKGPVCQCKCCGDVSYNLLDAASYEVVGKVAKNWSGLLKEAFTAADSFTLTFPPNTNAKVKSILLGSAFLIDYMFF